MSEAGNVKRAPPIRAEFVNPAITSGELGVAENPLSWFERLRNNEAARKAFILAVLALAWESYARLLDNDLIFPTLTQTVQAF